ncbi:hypothetical protein T05_4906 [Trichinella murrelli]|uniref:Uncharacterized protein n=1 Tax=Trichinella murrelli TaxID=144512 RepID=A0A0V0TAV9_9BILA|nr:hypothetical protein T05_4906 [Trichinella murrelli]
MGGSHELPSTNKVARCFLKLNHRSTLSYQGEELRAVLRAAVQKGSPQ